MHDSIHQNDNILFHRDYYESAGKGGLAVCTSAEGAVDIIADDDCWSN